MPKPMTRVLSLPWSLLMQARRRLYGAGLLPSESVGIPVISVGNISLGGTGKSPLVRHLAQAITIGREHELSAVVPSLRPPVAILSRGYRRHSRGWGLVSQGAGPLLTVEESGDEPLMLARQLPEAWVAVCEDRRQGARRLESLGAGCVLLDDGFQHLALRRDRNLLLWDCAVDPDREPVLPFGRLRENPRAALDADVLVFTRPNPASLQERLDWFSRLFLLANQPFPPAFTAEAEISRFTHPASGLSCHPASVGRYGIFCGIAAPERFLKQAEILLGPSAWSRCRGDHAKYGDADIHGLHHAIETHGLRHLITTWKDFVRLPESACSTSADLPLLVADLALRIQPVQTYLARHD